MAARHPLRALLSGALVALTIDIAPAAGPWLTSLVMWANCLRWIDDAGTPRAELERRARTTMLALSGMQRWGYLRVTPASLVVPTARGLRARAVWAKVVAAKDGRLAERYGADAIGALRAACAAVGAAAGSGPDYLPVVGYGLATPSDTIVPGAAPSATGANVPLVLGLARVLLEQTLAFERDARASPPKALRWRSRCCNRTATHAKSARWSDRGWARGACSLSSVCRNARDAVRREPWHALRFRRRQRCRTHPWCCIAEASRTGREPNMRAGRKSDEKIS